MITAFQATVRVLNCELVCGGDDRLSIQQVFHLGFVIILAEAVFHGVLAARGERVGETSSRKIITSCQGPVSGMADRILPGF